MNKINEGSDVATDSALDMVREGAAGDDQQMAASLGRPEESKPSGGQAKPPLCDEIEEGRLLARASNRPRG